MRDKLYAVTGTVFMSGKKITKYIREYQQIFAEGKFEEMFPDECFSEIKSHEVCLRH